MTAEAYDVVVVGGGTAGTFAAATAAGEGLDVVLLERKSQESGGHIACGDALKGPGEFPDVVDRDRLTAEAFSNQEIRRVLLENPDTDRTIEVEVDEGAVLDRYAYGQVLLDEAARAGADVHYDTVVQDVRQPDHCIEGVRATRNGSQVEYAAPITIDAAGALSILQDKADLSGATFDTNVTYQQFASAYREVIEVPEPVEWHDALVFKPTEEYGYMWYFPRSPTVINAGLGFQMDKSPIQMIEALARDLRNRPEFQDATVKETLGRRDKLGAALPTRRPYDSAVAPGFLAAGDAACHVNPTTGYGIPGAATAGHAAAEEAAAAIAAGDVSEEQLWGYNRRVMAEFGTRFAAMDLYNIWAGSHDVGDLLDVLSAVPGQQLLDVMASEDETSMGLRLKLETLFGALSHWDILLELYRLDRKSTEIRDRYGEYPDSPGGFEEWRERRDDVLDDVYEITSAEPKY